MNHLFRAPCGIAFGLGALHTLLLIFLRVIQDGHYEQHHLDFPGLKYSREINCIGPHYLGCDCKFHHSAIRQPWTCFFDLSSLQIPTCKMGMAQPAMESSYENKMVCCA